MITNNTITARFTADRHATIAWKQQLSADLDTIVTAYGAADKPADTIATAAAEIGIDRVRAIIATLTVYRVAMHDRRIGDDTAAWAQTIADALDAAAEYVEPEIVTEAAEVEAAEPETETAETTETAPAAEPHYLPAAAAQEEQTPGLNPMCRECTRCGIDCKGTTCRAFTGCIYREWLGSRKRSETPAHITDASTAKLLDYWDYVRRLSYSAATAITRGWVLDELARRDPEGYDRWVDDDAPGDYDATLRDFIRCDDAHVAWYAPQCDVTWHPGDAARKGARA